MPRFYQGLAPALIQVRTWALVLALHAWLHAPLHAFLQRACPASTRAHPGVIHGRLPSCFACLSPSPSPPCADDRATLPQLPQTQGPLSRFGDTAANTAVLTVLEDVDMPVAAKTVCASLAAGLFRIFLMPVDAAKTIMQVRAPFEVCVPFTVRVQSTVLWVVCGQWARRAAHVLRVFTPAC